MLPLIIAPKINQPPTAIVNPASQTVTLPTKRAIIDGSKSTDEDTDTLTFKWGLKTGPLAYEKPIESTQSTLTLEGLVAGNYTIRLTVTDAQGMYTLYECCLQSAITFYVLDISVLAYYH